VQGEGYLPPLQRSGEGVRAAQAERGSLGKPLAGARGKHPLAAFAFVVACCISGNQGEALRGGKGPAEEGGGRRALAAGDREETSSRQKRLFVNRNHRMRAVRQKQTLKRKLGEK